MADAREPRHPAAGEPRPGRRRGWTSRVAAAVGVDYDAPLDRPMPSAAADPGRPAAERDRPVPTADPPPAPPTVSGPPPTPPVPTAIEESEPGQARPLPLVNAVQHPPGYALPDSDWLRALYRPPTIAPQPQQPAAEAEQATQTGADGAEWLAGIRGRLTSLDRLLDQVERRAHAQQQEGFTEPGTPPLR